MSSVRSHYAALGLILVALVLGVSTPARASTGIGWLTVPVAGPTGINSMAASSANDLWIVGEEGHGFAQHWNGASWDPPQIAATDGNSTLYGVTEISPANLWAVGNQYSIAAQTDETLIEHGNGTTWKVVPSPDPATHHILSDVAGSSASNVWAVGQDFDPSAHGGQGSYEALLLHYDGTSWTQVGDASSGLDYGELTSVSTISGSDAWAVGRASTPSNDIGPFAERWNGTAWKAVPLPAAMTTVTQVLQFGHDDVWVLGADASGGLLEHWNGSGWSAVPTASTGTLSSNLSYVGGSSSHDLYVVGSVEGEDGLFDLIEHWDGTSWTVQESPNPNGQFSRLNRLLTVVSPSTGVAFAAGSSASAPTVLELGTGDFTSSIALTTASAGTAGQPLTLSGHLQLSEGAGTWNAILHLDRQNPDGTHTALPDPAVDDLGFYEVTDTPRSRGSYVYTVSYPGTDVRSGAQDQATVNVKGIATSLTLHPSATSSTTTHPSR